jgi:transcriptional regulator with XRE-family HTH domain
MVPAMVNTRPPRQPAFVATTRDRRARLGTLVRRARKARGLSQKQLAAAAALSMNTIGTIESGGSYREASLEDVALVLDWPAGATEAFLRGDDDAIPKPPVRPGRPSSAVTGDRARIMEASPGELVKMAKFVAHVLGAEAGDEFLTRAMAMRESPPPESPAAGARTRPVAS